MDCIVSKKKVNFYFSVISVTEKFLLLMTAIFFNIYGDTQQPNHPNIKFMQALLLENRYSYTLLMCG